MTVLTASQWFALFLILSGGVLFVLLMVRIVLTLFSDVRPQPRYATKQELRESIERVIARHKKSLDKLG